MAQFDNDRHSFIVRLWREPGDPEWRGSVVYLPTGERRFINRLGDIPGLILPHLGMTVSQQGFIERAKQKLKRFKKGTKEREHC